MLDKPLYRSVNWEKTLYIILIILALATRLWGLGDRVQSHDESIHTRYSWNLYTGSGFAHSPLMHGPFLFHVTALSYFFFGDNDFTARLPVALMGVALVAFPWVLRRWLGRTGALVTAFLLLISPSIAYYSRYIRHDIPAALWALVVIWALFAYLDDGRERWLYLMAGGVSLMFATKEVAFIYGAIIGFFLVGTFVVRALGRRWQREGWKTPFLWSLAVAAAGLALLGVGLATMAQPEQVAGEVVRATPPWWATVGGMLAAVALAAAVFLFFGGLGRTLGEYREYDLIILLGTLTLPFLSPVLIKAAGFDPLDYGQPNILYVGFIAGAVVVVSAAIGLWWNWRRWGIAAAIHYTIFTVLFTTVFTNGTGIASGLVGSLGYWLAQQAVERGSQPWYYYLVVVPFYDYLPLLLTLVAAAVVAVYLVRRRTQVTLFVAFLLWWIGTAWVGYSYAGEKMPWLAVHLALPMILLSGWLVGRLLDWVAWREVAERRGWLVALALPPVVAALAAVVEGAKAGPFQGYELAQLNATGQFLGAVVGLAAFGGGLGYLVRRSGWRVAVQMGLLTVLLVGVFFTVHTTWQFCYVNYDYPTEFLVYAHAGPAVRDTMEQIDELSRRIAGGPNMLKVAYGADGSTLWYWQLRNYPNAVYYADQPTRDALDAPVVIAGRNEWDKVMPYLERDYIFNTYTFLWWPMEDYRDMTWARIIHALKDPPTRAALWDIWYRRDYRKYDQVTGEQHTLDKWPLRSEYRLYVRRDVAAQMWDLGTVRPVELGPTDPYAEKWREVAARLVFGSPGSEPGQLMGPRGIAVGPDGYVYVADAGNHRVQKFTADGEFVTTWGQHSLVDEEGGVLRGFNEPWGVAVAPDGSVYVADTWNHRIQHFDAEGTLLGAWGSFGQYAVDDPFGEGKFYGPRGVVVSDEGLVYVTDTGNKRVQVFDADGMFAFQWGGGGVMEGNLDEPVGIALDDEGQVYVADTWNRRVQVFDADGNFVRQWPIEGWDTGLPEEKPYLAVDGEGYVYVTDPGHYRVLVFDETGEYVLSFGQYGDDERSFTLPTGVAVAEDGSIYVTDAQAGRVLVFDPVVGE